jgi:hypothetical protein
MTKTFEQFDLFHKNSPEKPLEKSVTVKKTPMVPFPNILLSSLNETDAKANAVYYLRIINKSSQKRLYNTSHLFDKKIFFNSLFNEINLKQGKKTPVLCCRSAILYQTILLVKRR